MAFWRNIKKKKGKLLRPGWYRGTIIGPHKGTEEGNQNNYWVTSNGKLILVSKEQLRPTYGTERWRIDEEELQDFLDFDYEEYDDETGEGPPEDEADSRDLEMVVPPLADELYSPSIAPDDVAAEQAPVQAHEVPIDDKSESMPSLNSSDNTQPHPDSPFARGQAPILNQAPGTPVGDVLRRRLTPRVMTPAESAGTEPFPKRLKAEESAEGDLPGDERPEGARDALVVDNLWSPSTTTRSLPSPTSRASTSRGKTRRP